MWCDDHFEEDDAKMDCLKTYCVTCCREALGEGASEIK